MSAQEGLSTTRRGIRRMGWGVADQALSSATNFALALVVARSVGVTAFGAFGLVFAVYTVFLGAGRALTTEPLALRYAAAPAAERAVAVRRVAGLALALGLGGAAACAAAGAVAGGTTGAGLVALAAGLPGLLLQDAWRLSFFVEGRGRSAFLNDAAWAGLLGVGLWALPSDAGVPELVGAWGAAGSAAAVVGAFQTGAAPARTGLRGWWTEQRGVAGHLFADFAALTAAAHLWLFGAAAVAGLDAAGALRGGQVLLGPLNVLFMGAALVAVPEAVAWLRQSPRTLVRGCLVTSAGLAGASLAWGAIALLLPDGAGEALLGETWDAARPVLGPLTVWMAASGVVAGLALGVRAAGRTGRGARLRAGAGVVSVAAATAGAAAAGPRGAAWALAGATVVTIAPWWFELRRATP